MPNAKPIKELVSLNILETLGTVTQASGYNVTLTVERARRPPNRPRHLLAVLHEGDEIDADEQALGNTEPIRRYAVIVYALLSEAAQDAGESYDAVLNIASADVEKVLLQDPYRGGYALNTIVQRPEKVDDPNEPPAIIVPFDVHYRTSETDPYANAEGN